MRMACSASLRMTQHKQRTKKQDMNLTEIIEKVLNNSQINLVITEYGYDWMPKNFSGQTEFLSIIDQDGLIAAWYAPGEPKAEGLAEWVLENTWEWIYDAIDNEESAHEPNEERIAFLNGLLETF